MTTYNKSQLVNKGKIRRIVIEYEEMNTPLVVLDGDEANDFLNDWQKGLPEGELKKLSPAQQELDKALNRLVDIHKEMDRVAHS